MTSLSTLLMMFAAVGVVFTIVTKLYKRTDNIFFTFLQHFCGVWFVFSGLVKAIDPIGTAYKMQDYFAAFETTFAGLTNVFKGLAPIFPKLSEMSEGFSIFMIVLEIVLGVALIVGWRNRLTAWVFFLTCLFFTKLTGFTYLTGYVPMTDNFFDFAKWGPYVKTQMRVTDCGCFGDFIKLDPKISFFKDLGLMIPALLFLFGWKRMHELFTSGWRTGIVSISTLLILLFCIRNTYWDLPVVDFRPFAIGTDVRKKKAIEEEARGNVEITGWVLQNDSLGKTFIFTEPEPGKITYYKQYPKNQGWKVKEQIKTEPHIVQVTGYELENIESKEVKTVMLTDTAEIFKQFPHAAGWQLKKEIGEKVPVESTKVSEFVVEGPNNTEVTEDILGEEGYSVMIVAYHFEGEKKTETFVVQDTTWAVDTTILKATVGKLEGKKMVFPDSMAFSRRVAGVEPRTIEKKKFAPDMAWGAIWKNKINPFAEAAEKAGYKVYAITTYADAEYAESFRHEVQAAYPFYKADDKLLKTIIRSNPGVVLWKDGKVVNMWHHRKLPTFEQVKQ